MLLVMTLVFQSSVDKMMQKANNSMMVGSSSWLDQFTEAFTVQAGEDPLIYMLVMVLIELNIRKTCFPFIYQKCIH